MDTIRRTQLNDRRSRQEELPLMKKKIKSCGLVSCVF